MGLSWQQGPLAPGAIGRFLVPDPLPKRVARQNSVPARKSKVSSDSSETLKRFEGEYTTGWGVPEVRKIPWGFGLLRGNVSIYKDGVRPCISELSAWIKQPDRNDDAALPSAHE